MESLAETEDTARWHVELFDFDSLDQADESDEADQSEADDEPPVACARALRAGSTGVERLVEDGPARRGALEQPGLHGRETGGKERPVASPVASPDVAPAWKSRGRGGDYRQDGGAHPEDWCAAFWDEEAERACFRAVRDPVTVLLCGCPECTLPQHSHQLGAGATVRLLPGNKRAQRIDESGVRWALVELPGSEGVHADLPSGAAKTWWWAQLDGFSLVPNIVGGPESALARVNEWLRRGEGGGATSEEYRRARLYRWKLSRYRRHLCDVQPLRESRQERLGPAYISGGPLEGSTHAVPEGRFTAARRAASRSTASMAGLPSVQMVAPCAVRGRVTVVCPTYPSRHHLHQELYRYFVDQDWPDKELIVLDTGSEASPFFTHAACGDKGDRALPCSPLEDARVMYVHLHDDRLTLGHKRNLLIQLSSGEFVAHFDDDNIYAPQYLTAMVGELRASSAQLVSLSAAFAWTPRTDALRWHDDRVWGRAETVVHLRGPLNVMAFAHNAICEEAPFLSAALSQGVLDTFGIFAHINHGGNVSSYEHDFEKKRPGEPIALEHVPNPQLRALVSRHPLRRAVAEKP